MTPKQPLVRCVQSQCGCSDSSFVWIWHERETIWFEVPKAGSKSVKTALGITRPGVGTSGGFVNVDDTPLQAAQRYPGYFKFAFVRNPWAKMVSAWSMFCRRGDPHRVRQIEALFGLPHADVDFERFVRLAAKVRNHHWEQCVRYLPVTGSNDVLLDAVASLDDMDAAIAQLSDHLQRPLKLERLNGSPHDHYARYYDSHTEATVRSMFLDDIATFGFEFVNGVEY